MTVKMKCGDTVYAVVTTDSIWTGRNLELVSAFKSDRDAARESMRVRAAIQKDDRDSWGLSGVDADHYEVEFCVRDNPPYGLPWKNLKDALEGGEPQIALEDLDVTVDELMYKSHVYRKTWNAEIVDGQAVLKGNVPWAVVDRLDEAGYMVWLECTLIYEFHEIYENEVWIEEGERRVYPRFLTPKSIKPSHDYPFGEIGVDTGGLKIAIYHTEYTPILVANGKRER